VLCQYLSLIEATLFEAVVMQGHRNNCVGGQGMEREIGLQQVAQRSCHTSDALILEAVYRIA
jgi:hypothetical protein